MADLTPAAYQAKWNQRFRDNDQFEIDEADFRENVADQLRTFAPLAAAAGKTPNELLLPQQVVGGQWYWWSTGVFEARSTFQASAAPVAGPNWRLVVGLSIFTPQDALTAATAGQARLIRPNAATLSFATVALANAQADYGDTVAIIGTQQLSSLTLRGGVTYATGGLAVNWDTLTDSGADVITCKVSGNSPEGRYGGGGLVISGPGTDVVIEKALYPSSSGITVLQSAGKATHSGLLRGSSPNETVCVLSGTADFRHISGRVVLGGSKGFVLSGTAKALIKSDGPIQQGFGRLVEAGPGTKIRLEGGSFCDNGGNPNTQLGYINGGEVTYANGTYDNTSTGASGILVDEGGTVIIENAIIVKNITGTSGTVILRNGGKCLGGISAALTVVNENGEAGGGDEPYQAQVIGANSYNDLVVLVTAPRLFRPGLLVNASGWKAQVLKTTDNTAWAVERTAATDVTADLAAAFASAPAPAAVLLRVLPVRVDAARNAYFNFYLD